MTGYLLHVYHLGSKDWERLVWGDPNRDELGAAAKLCECLLSEPADVPVACIIYSGPSHRDGLGEGAYTKKFLIDRLAQLSSFPRLQKKLARLTEQEYNVFRGRIEAIVLGEDLANTLEEVQRAALYFKRQGAERVVHVAAASHAPRCIQVQTIVRHQGLIPLDQQWYTVASDISFEGTVPSDVVVIEPSHRGDDPLLEFEPQLSRAIKPYFALSTGQKKDVIRAVASAMQTVQKRPASRFIPSRKKQD